MMEEEAREIKGDHILKSFISHSKELGFGHVLWTLLLSNAMVKGYATNMIKMRGGLEWKSVQ